jgi:competence protein ComEC
MINNRLLWIVFLVFVLLVGCTPTNEQGQSVSTQVSKQATVSTTASESQSNQSSQSKKQAEEPTNGETSSEPKLETKGELKVHYIDVGQGASQLIVGSTGKTMLIDAGNNIKAGVVVEYLKQQRISKIDILVGTHPDADHIGGLDAVIDNFEIGKIYMPKVQSNTKTFEDVLMAVQRKGLKVTTAKSGLTLDWETDTTVKMIAPVAQYSDTNDMSAVIHLTYGQTSFLFTGDAEYKSEQDMIGSKVKLKSDVLLVGHHGSKSSSSQAFLDAVKPSYAVIQVGKDNNYGHPTAEVLKRLMDMGVKTYRNDERGNIIFTTNGKNIVVKYDGGVTAPTKSDSAPTSNTNPPTPEPTVVPKQQEANVVYKNCSEVKAAGKAPLHRGDPGYSSKLDRDNDGLACE